MMKSRVPLGTSLIIHGTLIVAGKELVVFWIRVIAVKMVRSALRADTLEWC